MYIDNTQDFLALYSLKGIKFYIYKPNPLCKKECFEIIEYSEELNTFLDLFITYIPEWSYKNKNKIYPLIFIPNGYLDVYQRVNSNNIYKRRRLLCGISLYGDYNNDLVVELIAYLSPNPNKETITLWEDIGPQIKINEIFINTLLTEVIPINYEEEYFSFRLINPEEPDSKEYLYKVVKKETVIANNKEGGFTIKFKYRYKL
jgi:hypothetical protein